MSVEASKAALSNANINQQLLQQYNGYAAINAAKGDPLPSSVGKDNAENAAANRQRGSKKKVFEYRGSADLAPGTQQQLQQDRSKKPRAVVDDYSRQQQVQNEAAQGGFSGSFGLSEIVSPPSYHQGMHPGGSQHPTDIIARPTAYQLKRQQAHQRQKAQREAEGIVGRRVDAPHIIVPQGPVGKSEYEAAREQGNIVQSMVSVGPPSQMMKARGQQTISLSPKHSPWKKATGKNSASNYARGKPKNLFGQVKLCFAQSGAGKKSTSNQKTDKTVQKNFKSQPGKGAVEGKSRASKSMEQVRQVHRQPNFAGSSQNVPKSGHRQDQAKKGSQGHAQNEGRKTAMHSHDRPELSTDALKQRRSGATTRLQRSQVNNFLDASMAQNRPVDRAGNATQIQIQNQSSESAQNQFTLNILTATADQFANQGGASGGAATGHNVYPSGAKCKSAAAKHHPKDQSRQLIQTKYLNFQREANNQAQSKKRASRSVENSGAVNRTNHHRATGGGARAKTALQAQSSNATRPNSKNAVANPFKPISSSQGRASGSGGAASAGHSRAFGASKNQTIEIELQRRSKSRQGTSGILSDTPGKEKSRQRARSGGSSNKRKQQLLGASESFSPRSRATTQFQEARSLLFENQSSGLSVNSKKQNLNQLLSNLEGRHKKSSNQKPIAGSQEYIAALNQSLHGPQVPAAGASAVNLTSALDPAYNLSSVLLQQQPPPTDPNNSIQQYLRGSNDNLRSTTIAETQVGDASQPQLAISGSGAGEGSRSAASRKMAHLNASLGRILNQSTLQRRDGSSQSPKGARGSSKGPANQQQAVAGKSSNVASASNTSRIDKIIQENLKKQGKKTMQRRIREQEEEQVSRKKKAELELVNERVRTANKEKVQRRKQQQMLLVHTNGTLKALKTGDASKDPTADAIRDEMTRMLDALPENAIFKSNKTGKTRHEAPLQQSSLGGAAAKPPTDDNNAARSGGGASKNNLQARTQKIDLKFNSQHQRMEGLMLRVQKQTSNVSKNSKTNKSKDGMPPKQLVVNRLGLTRKEESGEPIPGQKSRKQRSQERSQQQTQLQPPSEHINENDSTMPLPAAESSTRISGVRFKDHRKSYGLEFIDIRREINAELRKVGGGRKSPKGTTGKKTIKPGRANLRYIMKDKGGAESTGESGILTGGKNLRGSKSQKQVLAGQSSDTTLENVLEGHEEPANADLNILRLMNESSIPQNQTAVLRPGQINITALRIKPAAADRKANQSMTTNGVGVVIKKEKIRKFMLRKQKQKQEEEEKTKLAEIKKTLKVHQNLLNLDKFAKKKLKVLQTGGGGPRTGKAAQSGPQGNLRHRNQLTMRKNMTLIHEQPESSQLIQGSTHNLTLTPSKTALEVSEPSFNISAKLNQRVSSKQLKRLTKNKDVSQDALISMLDPAQGSEVGAQLQQDGKSSSQQRHRRSSQSRDQPANRSITQLAPQFENSTSAKTLRAQLRTGKQNSSQSPPPQTSANVSRAEQASLVSKIAVGSRKAVQIGKPPHALLGQSNKDKNLRVGKKQTNRQQRKRGKSSNRRSQGGACTIQLNSGKHLNVRVPEAGGLPGREIRQYMDQPQPGAVMGDRTGAHHQHHHSSIHRSSTHTLESEPHQRQLSSVQQRHRMPSSLISAQRMSRDGAATVIQVEVRKYLKQIGFYHARQIDSPDREAQISLFIEKRSRKSRSRDSKKSKQSRSRSGSRGLRQSPKLSLPASELPSPDHKKETTMIVQLSGLRQTDLFEDEDSEMMFSEVKHEPVEPRGQQRPKKPAQRKGGRAPQQSSSSERDTSAKRQLARRQSAKHSAKSKNRNTEAAPTPPGELKPSKQLNPVFKDIETGLNENVKTTQGLHEILSVQTPQSRNSKHHVMNLDPPQSQQSLSAHRISDSEFEFRQAQSSVESNSIERLGFPSMANGGHVNDGASQSSNSLFDRNAFQQYSQKKLNVIMQNSEHSKLIKFKEEVLKFKEQKERKHIKKLFKQNKFSPRTFQAKQKQIDRWVQVQKQEIEKTKTTFKEEWDKTVQMIEDTQKNVDQMKSKMNLGPTHHSNSGVVSASGASGAKNNVLGSANQLNNFNSQSCNSLSSHRNYQRSSNIGSNGVGGNQLALSGLGEHQRSILIEDPPKSYRSGRQEIPQMQILPIAGGVLPENNAEDTGHGSMGLLSSRRSANGQGDNLHMAQSLLQYMEQRLASHNEHKQTSLSELKSKNGGQSEQNLQDEEQQLKQAMDQIEVKAPPAAVLVDEPVEPVSLTKSQQMVGLSNTLDRGHTHNPSQASNVESEISHQPSAEFLERLERVNKNEPLISSAKSDKLLGSGDFTGSEEPMLPSGLVSDTDHGGDQSNLGAAAHGDKQSEREEMSTTDKLDRGNFKNQVMMIKDFGAIDSKRTSQQSETSNEREFMAMLATQKSKNDREGNSNGISPTAEHLEEPSIVGKREIEQATVESMGNEAAQQVQNIRIADMLKHQSKDIEEIIKEQSSHRSDTAAAEDSNLLQEPAIISSSQTLDGSSAPANAFSFSQNSSTLVAAKVKPSSELSQLKLEEIETLLRSEQTSEKDKIVESLTDEMMKQLISDCVNDIPSRKGKSSAKDSSQTASQPNHDVYYIDQLQSEKEERKEWIELRQRHLIENDLIRIDQYVNEIVDALLQFDIDLSSDEGESLLMLQTESERERRKKELAENYHIQFLRMLTQPIQKSSHDILQTLQTSEIGSYKHFETTQDLQKYPIIPVNLYLEIEKAREEALLARKGSNMSKQTQMVWESIHIQNKSFFDAINESLMKFRPYGLTGEPMPWSNKIRRLQTKVDIGSVDTERLFQMVKQEVFRWSQAFCGALPSPVFCFPSSSAAREKEDFNDELFQENREKRLTQVLSAETVEQEHHWLNYEYEEAQVKIDLSDMILEHLVDELATFLNQRQGGVAEAADRPPNVEIYELMNDEPEFAKSEEHAAGSSPGPPAFSPARGDLQVKVGQTASSLQKLDKGGRLEA